mgnify:CR=1 FL=1
MQDKSSFGNSSNQPQISEGLQNFINAMVEEIVLKGEPFDEQKKKYLKKYSEAEKLNYGELERNLNDFFELLEVENISESNVLKRYYYETSEKCYLMQSLAAAFLERKQVKKMEESNSLNRQVFNGSLGGLVGAHLLD